uniref:F-box domain-containing protein n=1 Tax=Glossina austeni TaxID=7395 RepID=A0A1A9V532_GLOAU
MSSNSPGDRTNEDETAHVKNNVVAFNTPSSSTDKSKVNHKQQQQQKQRLEMPLPEIANLECLLVLDTTSECAPLHLQYVLNSTDCHQSSGELLFLLVYTVALESGYMCEINSDFSKAFISPLPSISSFHSKNVLRLSRLKPTFTISADRTRYAMKLCSIIDSRQVVAEQMHALLTAIVSGDLMILALSPANCMYADGFSCALSIPRHVLSAQSKENPPFQRFRKMDELTNILRDELFVPMRNKQLYWMQAHVYPSLDALPAELYEYILKHLDKNQMNILANVNRSLHNIVIRNKYFLNSDHPRPDYLSRSFCGLMCNIFTRKQTVDKYQPCLCESTKPKLRGDFRESRSRPSTSLSDNRPNNKLHVPNVGEKKTGNGNCIVYSDRKTPGGRRQTTFYCETLCILGIALNFTIL